MKKLIKHGMLICAATLISQVVQAELTAELSLPETQNTGNFDVLLTITNTGDKPEKILRRLVGADGVKDHILHVVVNGQKIPYIGPHYKWGEPTEHDYMIIQSGESVTHTLNVSGNYFMELDGYYEISFAFEHHHIEQEKQHAKHQIEAESQATQLVAWSESISAPVYPAKPTYINYKTLAYENCSASQEQEISQALDEAIIMSQESVDVMNRYTDAQASQSERYSTWFGAYERSRWDTVKSGFEKILHDLEHENVVINCDCNEENVFAMVRPLNHWRIYVCPLFWQASLIGRDSKAGTLVHEMSHFNVVAQTDDHAYGHQRVKSLATLNPQEAVKNADSYEYFAENDPQIEDVLPSQGDGDRNTGGDNVDDDRNRSIDRSAGRDSNMVRGDSEGGGAMSLGFWVILFLVGRQRSRKSSF